MTGTLSLQPATRPYRRAVERAGAGAAHCDDAVEYAHRSLRFAGLRFRRGLADADGHSAAAFPGEYPRDHPQQRADVSRSPHQQREDAACVLAAARADRDAGQRARIGVNFMTMKATYNLRPKVTNPLIVADNFVMAGLFVARPGIATSRC